MRIEVVAGVGEGQTELGAYDAAEAKMAAENYNLIRMTSVIPPNCEVVDVDGPSTVGGEWGDKLWCIYANKRTSKPGEEVWAGIGWIMLGEKGLFCEHEGNSKTEVEGLIRGSLMTFMTNRGLEPDESLIHMKVTGTTCKDRPVCAMVMAIYRAEGW